MNSFYVPKLLGLFFNRLFFKFLNNLEPHVLEHFEATFNLEVVIGLIWYWAKSQGLASRARSREMEVVGIRDLEGCLKAIKGHLLYFKRQR